MSSFDKRGEAFENKYALDESQKFKAEARRNKLLGLWVAEQLGKSGDEAAAYAKEVVAADFEEAGDGDVVRKVLTDLTAKGVEVLYHDLDERPGAKFATADLIGIPYQVLVGLRGLAVQAHIQSGLHSATRALDFER